MKKRNSYTVKMPNGDIAVVVSGEYFGSRRPYFSGEKADYKYGENPDHQKKKEDKDAG